MPSSPIHSFSLSADSIPCNLQSSSFNGTSKNDKNMIVGSKEVHMHTELLESHNAFCKQMQKPEDSMCQKSFGKRRVTLSSLPESKVLQKKRRRCTSVTLPTKFLLGGTITDPLNLSSLQDDKNYKHLNIFSPVNSPLTTTQYQTQVNLRIPVNINDPLNLNSGESVRFNAGSKSRKRRRHRRIRRDEESEENLESMSDYCLPYNPDKLLIQLNCDKVTKQIKQNVNQKVKVELAEKKESLQSSPIHVSSPVYNASSPVYNASSPVYNASSLVYNASSPVYNASSPAYNASSPIYASSVNNTSSPVNNVSSPVYNVSSPVYITSPVHVSSPIHKISSPSYEVSSPVYEKVDPVPECSKKINKHTQEQIAKDKILAATIKQKSDTIKFRENAKKFCYGNHGAGRANWQLGEDNKFDDRLKFFDQKLFCDKEVLDIGCGSGELTLHIAEYFKPRKVLGLDIDKKLLNKAQKQMRLWLNMQLTPQVHCPRTMAAMFGPLLKLNVTTTKSSVGYPNNTFFLEANYVPDCEDDLELQKPQFDTILCLRVTKWIHLNFGDSGLKLAFKKMFAQLRVGGHLILEPQPWFTYSTSKRITPSIHETFNSLKMKPESFCNYLQSTEVGFSSCQLIGRAFNYKKDYWQDIYLFTKEYDGQNVRNASSSPTFPDDSSPTFPDDSSPTFPDGSSPTYSTDFSLHHPVIDTCSSPILPNEYQ